MHISEDVPVCQVRRGGGVFLHDQQTYRPCPLFSVVIFYLNYQLRGLLPAVGGWAGMSPSPASSVYTVS